MKSFKLTYKNKEKKIDFTKDLQNLDNLYKSVCDITKLEKNQMKISFIDIEDEKVDLNDIHDWHYFIGQASENGSSLKIEKISRLKKKEKNPKIKKVEEIPKVEKIKEDQKDKKINKNIKLDESDFYVIENSDNDEKKSRIEHDKQGLMEEFQNAGLLKNYEPIIRNTQSAKIFKTENFEKTIKKECYLAEELKKSFSLLSEDINNSLKNVQKKSKEIMQNVLPQILDKFDLEKKKDEKKSNKIEICTYHIGITCNICGVSPIIGKRFKCTICKNYNLCVKCEDSTIHKHPMLRFIEQENKTS